MNILVREAAYADLEGIHAYIAQESPASANPVIQHILDGIERLGIFPSLGRRGILEGTREWVVRGLPYIIVYRIDKALAEVTVIGVFHGAQDVAAQRR